MPYTSIKLNKPGATRWSREKMFNLATQAAVIIIQRAQHGGGKGHGLDDAPHKTYRQTGGKGKSFGAYSLSHGRLRSEGGNYNKIKIGGGLPTNHVTLSVTGTMFRQFRAIKSTALRDYVIIRSTGNSRKYSGFVNARRPWIGLSNKDREGVLNVFRALWAT